MRGCQSIYRRTKKIFFFLIDGTASQAPPPLQHQTAVTNGAPLAPVQSPAETAVTPAVVPPGLAPASNPSSTTTHPCSNNISTCFHLIAEQMNKTEELLKMANETLSSSSSKNTNGTTGNQAGAVVAPTVVTPQQMAPPAPQQSPVVPATALPPTGTGKYVWFISTKLHNFYFCIEFIVFFF